MYTLGIKPSLGNLSVLKGGGRHDGGACLINNGEIIAAAEEERFSRNKHALDEFPKESIEYVLSECDVSLADIDAIGIGRDRSNRRKMAVYDPRSYVPTSAEDVFFLFREVSTILAERKGAHVDTVAQQIEDTTKADFTGEYHTVSHHRCHAASAAYCDSKSNPAVITVDARGEHDSTVLWDTGLSRVKTFPWYNSIGLFYACGCRYLGFRRGWDAGKVMGLAPYGTQREAFADTFESLVEYGGGEYDVTAVTRADNPVELFEEYFGPRRVHPDEFEQHHKDFAYHLQAVTESIVLDLVEHHLNGLHTGSLALAGGVAMNCKLNYEVANHELVESLFIQPAANDSGICLGAALEAYKEVTGTAPNPTFEDLYLGPSYTNDEIEQRLQAAKIDYERVEDICSRVARLLADGNLVGWFQGRMEFGPRALGNRSILADPRTDASLNNVNRNVKNREPWRPFAPSITREAAKDYLGHDEARPFMIILDRVPPEKQEEVEAIVHVDGTTRPQTVTEKENGRYYRLLKEFQSLTGVPVLLNTSFNISGEPIVESPTQALQDYFATGLDALALGDYLLTKSSVDN